MDFSDRNLYLINQFLKFIVLILISLFFLFLLKVKASADLTQESFANGYYYCTNWLDIANSLGPPDSSYASLNSYPVCSWKFPPFNIPSESTINRIITKIYNSSTGNIGFPSMSPAYSNKQSCIPPPFWPGTLYNNVHDYIVTPENCSKTMPTVNQLNSTSMSWHFYNSYYYYGRANLKTDAISMQVDYTPNLISPAPTPFLEIPFDYAGKSFDEIALNPESWFDHESPLQNVPCCNMKVLSYVGHETNDAYRSHSGYDYALQNGIKLNTPILAAASGWATFTPESNSGGAGNIIKIDHENGYQTWYEHLGNEELVVSNTNDKTYVNKGDKIGLVGMTGNTNGPHIHLSAFKDSNENDTFSDDWPFGLVDPLGWEGSTKDPWEDWTQGGRTGTKSYNLFLARKNPVSKSVPDQGGTISEGNLILTIAASAYNGALNFSIKNGPFEKKGVNFKSILPSLFIEAFNSLNEKVTQFTEPIEIKIDYSNADLSNIDENSLKIYFFNASIGEWEELSSVLNKVNKTVVALTDHFSQFALMGELKDLIAPETETILKGIKGQDNWYGSDVGVELKGVDNTGGLGIEETIYSLNGNDWFEYYNPVSFDEEGAHEINYMSYDKADNREQIKDATFYIDTTPPIISADSTVDGLSYTPNTWTNKNVTTAFTCSDALSGIKSTSEPVVISTEGKNQSASGRCEDKAGNVSEVEVSGINIDKTPPKISLRTDPATIWPPNGKLIPVKILGGIEDISPTENTFTFSDEYGMLAPSNLDFGQTLLLEAKRYGSDIDGRIYTIGVTTKDEAGNNSSSETFIIVPHDKGNIKIN